MEKIIFKIIFSLIYFFIVVQIGITVFNTFNPWIGILISVFGILSSYFIIRYIVTKKTKDGN